MDATRTGNVIRNSWYGFANKIITLIFSFAVRTLFIKTLGAEYLGIEGLFTNILALLSLAELGIGNVLTYSLYKPIAEHDDIKVNQIVHFYKKMYYLIAVIVALIGFMFVPFLKYIVNSSFSDVSILKFYLFYLLNSVISYVSACNTTLIKAEQEQYIIDVISSAVKFVSAIAQIIVLVISQNFIAFLVITVSATLLQNIIASAIAKKKYNLVRTHENISSQEKRKIFLNIKATFLYKIGVIIINSTDNILISVLVGTVFVGYYSNYTLIVNTINALVSILCSALIASIGNMSAEGDISKSNTIFKRLVIFFHFFSALFSVGFCLVFNDVISIWIGSTNTLEMNVVLAISFSFYIQNIINPVWMYREAYGLFEQIKFLMLITAFLNIIFSVLFGKMWGIAGIVAATGISRFLTTVWYEPKILYKNIFQRDGREYIKLQGRFVVSTLLSFGISWLIISRFLSGVSLIIIFVKCFVIFLVVFSCFFIQNYKLEEFKYWISFTGIVPKN